jgi:hypothetical protein
LAAGGVPKPFQWNRVVAAVETSTAIAGGDLNRMHTMAAGGIKQGHQTIHEACNRITLVGVLIQIAAQEVHGKRRPFFDSCRKEVLKRTLTEHGDMLAAAKVFADVLAGIAKVLLQLYASIRLSLCRLT